MPVISSISDDKQVDVETGFMNKLDPKIIGSNGIFFGSKKKYLLRFMFIMFK